VTAKTKIIYLIGLSGAGKYTIAKEIAKEGYRIADEK
jgi:shikimate kinase